MSQKLMYLLVLVALFSGGTKLVTAQGTPLCVDPQPQLITDFQVYQLPQFPEPQPRVPFRDPVFGSCVVRVTDRTSDLAAGDLSGGLVNEYSRVQAFNADGSRLLVRSTEADWYVYDAYTLQPLDHLVIGGSIDPRWDATDPDLLYYIDDTRLTRYQVTTRAQSVVHEFAADFPGQNVVVVWTRYEGSPSWGGRYWGFMAEDEEFLASALLVYDQATDTVVAVRDMRNALEVDREIDTVTISPLSTYFLAYYDDYCPHGQLGDDQNPCGLMVYDRNLSNGRGLLRIVGHSDVALDSQGWEVLVYQDIDTDYISMLDLATGVVTPLWPIDFGHTGIGFHFSGRALERPGWALVSTYNGGFPTQFTWMDNQIFVIELAPGGQVVRLAHTHSLYDENQEQDYWAEPRATVNQDFTRILFTTNWGRTGTDQVEMFLIALPPEWPGLLSSRGGSY